MKKYNNYSLDLVVPRRSPRDPGFSLIFKFVTIFRFFWTPRTAPRGDSLIMATRFLEINTGICKYVCILLIGSLIFFNTAFALTEKDKKNQEQEAQKMTQLKQILAQISSGEKNANSKEVATSTALTPATTTNISNQSVQVPAALAPALAASASSQGVQAPTALAPAVSTEAKKQPDLYDTAFSGVVNEMLPMSPAQINKLKEVFIDTQLAVGTPPGNPPKPTTSSILVNLSPQATAPVIRLSAGYLTSLVFIDATGQPWPIAAFSVGDPGAFNIQWDRKSNNLITQSSTFYKRSNLAVMLKDLNTPVMITLLSGQQAVDYRVDLRVPGIGPNAIYVQNGIPDTINPILFDVLNGVTPKGGKELKVTGSGNTKAWLLNDKNNKKMYVRTDLTITSPGWQSTMSSADGTHAYQLQPVPVILALQHGKDKTIRLMIEGLE